MPAAVATMATTNSRAIRSGRSQPKRYVTMEKAPARKGQPFNLSVVRWVGTIPALGVCTREIHLPVLKQQQLFFMPMLGKTVKSLVSVQCATRPRAVQVRGSEQSGLSLAAVASFVQCTDSRPRHRLGRPHISVVCCTDSQARRSPNCRRILLRPLHIWHTQCSFTVYRHSFVFNSPSSGKS